MVDLTILQTTANLLSEETAKKIQDHLLSVVGDSYPIISVSRKPMKFGKNICIGEAEEAGKYCEYKQILLGSMEVTTEYTACVDDDTLYSAEHFNYRPPKGLFAYETNYWFAEEGKPFYWRAKLAETRGGMWGCIVKTDLLRHNLTRRFAKYPNNPWAKDSQIAPPLHWGEPGIHDREYGLQEEAYEKFESPTPSVVFVHTKSMGFKQLSRFHRRYGHPTPDNRRDSIEGFGTPTELYNYYWK